MDTPAHGGRRPGAGRKPGSGPFAEPTKPVRIPVSQVDTMRAFIQQARQPATAEHPRPVSTETAISLRAFASRIPAGFPSPAADYLDDSIDLNAELIIQGHEAATFILRVKGWSTVNAGIFDGDRIVVDRALSAQQGDIVVAVLNDDLTIKHLGQIDGRPALLPDNPQFQPIVMADGDQLEVWDVVTNCLRSSKRGGR